MKAPDSPTRSRQMIVKIRENQINWHKKQAERRGKQYIY